MFERGTVVDLNSFFLEESIEGQADSISLLSGAELFKFRIGCACLRANSLKNAEKMTASIICF